MELLVTGAAGFVGSHFVEHILHNTDWSIVALDRLTYAGRLDRLAHLRGPRLKFVYHDFRAPLHSGIPSTDAIVHFGAETHVENSLISPRIFVESNVLGTLNVLEHARQTGAVFVQVSTDEVFGPAPRGTDYQEYDRFAPTNPYSATKAGAECLAMAYARSYGVRVILTRTMNIFGERQHPEKFIPLCVKKILAGETISIHASPDGIPSSRKWLHARNQADALLFLLRQQFDTWPQTFHIAGVERDCRQIVQFIAEVIGTPAIAELVDFHSSRPGHDLRYSLDDSKIRALGWQQPLVFQPSLEKTIRWTLQHPEWLNVRPFAGSLPLNSVAVTT